MARRFTVIQGGLGDAVAAPPRGRALPGRAKLEAVGAALRRRLAALPRRKPGARRERAALAPARQPIPVGAFLGVRPEGWSRDAA
ncbi:hypothetical protein [Methylobacterium persicinum]|uniref:Uncharacterized protein n=1 Tax=Methylobacterium persicinum TaxID=374426 RepID=A0ABU0HTY2_9HYPH|nr:hypothetical protein [Methylobacterium persicinum]MDQ0444956.1 hypothetical protein [Methylobacterium persicinum]GJE40360.1 hypothetical protein KHHGKMAE_4452 [Methylobacterium persicinum]